MDDLAGAMDELAVGHGADDARKTIIDAIVEVEFKEGATANPLASSAPSTDDDEDTDDDHAEDGAPRTPPRSGRGGESIEAQRRRKQLQAMSPRDLNQVAEEAGVNDALANDESRNDWWGFSPSQRFFIVTSTIMPVADAWTDWALIIKWYYQLVDGTTEWDGGGADGGDTAVRARWSWFLAALAIQMLSGTMTGALLANSELQDIFNKRCPYDIFAYPFGIMAGVLGLAPRVEAGITTYDGYESTKVAAGDKKKQAEMVEVVDGDIWILKSIRALVRTTVVLSALYIYIYRPDHFPKAGSGINIEKTHPETAV